MSVKAWLEGDNIDLEELATLLPTGDTHVAREGNDYYLTSAQIDNPPAGSKFYDVAPQVLREINGLARVANAKFRPVRLSGKYHDGENSTTVVTVGTAEIRLQASAATVVTSPGGTAQQPIPSQGPIRLSLAASNPDVQEVLRIMGQPQPLGWVEMYKVYEIVRHEIKPRTIESLGWATRHQVSAFFRLGKSPGSKWFGGATCSVK